LRRQLKQISEELTEQLKKKKFVPKKKGTGGEEDDNEDAKGANTGTIRVMQPVCDVNCKTDIAKSRCTNVLSMP
jgi:hypothetical protein